MKFVLKIIVLQRDSCIYCKTYFNNENIFSNFFSYLLKVDFSSVFTYDLMRKITNFKSKSSQIIVDYNLSKNVDNNKVCLFPS